MRSAPLLEGHLLGVDGCGDVCGWMMLSWRGENPVQSLMILSARLSRPIMKEGRVHGNSYPEITKDWALQRPNSYGNQKNALTFTSIQRWLLIIAPFAFPVTRTAFVGLSRETLYSTTKSYNMCVTAKQ